ncbi:hypothetical protein PACTADRAFT_70729 [Pachysolen tannophilus NRRL Y-2460]|uniref:Adenylyl cyclase-associated protein n=1 Tax=Pachysolen tannophilus NRRL Y-2460 TaxID=669874 RepID=A0A1E4TR35_PACTA|nr:hypothetical protein PACTADRAFT_70729 [Pachysolen tannophilus NRRL Y-2460]
MSSENNFSIQGYNLVTLLKRLEAATSRLEDVTIFQENSKKDVLHASDYTATQRQAPRTKSVGQGAGQDLNAESSQPSAQASLPVSIKEFDSLIEGFVKPFVDKSEKVDPVVGEVGSTLLKAFIEERNFLLAVSKSKKIEPSNPIFAQALKPINEQIEKIIAIKDQNRRSKFFNNLNAVAEGIPVLGWVVVPTPISYIPEYKESTEFWSNRILKEFRDSADTSQVEWVKLLLSIFDCLKVYVKQYHSTGPSWDPNGGSLEDALAATTAAVADGPIPSTGPSSSTGAAAAPPPPPPPPPPPASVFESDPNSSSGAATSDTGINAVFSELNKGESITSSLKKVDKSQMTHKNPSLRDSSTVPAVSKKVPPKKPVSLSKKSAAAAAAAAAKPPKKELVDTKWVIENFENTHDLIVENGQMNQSVFIANCNNVTIQVKGKVNALSINNSHKVGLVVDSMVSGIDIIKCTKYGVQILDQVPTISIDASDSGQIYLSKNSLNTEIYTSCTTALNIEIPDQETGDFKEVPAPEQLRHSFDATGKMVTSIVEHAG